MTARDGRMQKSVGVVVVVATWAASDATSRRHSGSARRARARGPPACVCDYFLVLQITFHPKSNETVSRAETAATMALATATRRHAIVTATQMRNRTERCRLHTFDLQDASCMPSVVAKIRHSDVRIRLGRQHQTCLGPQHT